MRSVSRVEPEWDSVQRAVMIAYTRHRAETCPGCGEWLIESTDPANEGQYRTGLPVRCHACTPLQAAFETYRKASHSQALRFGVQLLTTERG